MHACVYMYLKAKGLFQMSSSLFTLFYRGRVSHHTWSYSNESDCSRNLVSTSQVMRLWVAIGPAFMWVEGIRNSIFILSQQVFYLPSHLPSKEFPDVNLEITSPCPHPSILGLGKCPKTEIHTYFHYLKTEERSCILIHNKLYDIG